jgi:hypothetical protein
MSPRERADRLFDRVMRLSSEGKVDSVQFFAPMVMQVYQGLGALDSDQRYDYGRVAEVVGAPEVARAQADSILRDNPNHLLGLILAAKAAFMRGDSTAVRGFERRLLQAAPAEQQKQLPEYATHKLEITNALGEAGKRR